MTTSGPGDRAPPGRHMHGLGPMMIVSVFVESRHFLRLMLAFLLFTAIHIVGTVGYVLLGSWLWERGARTSSTMLEGFGQSIVLQGAFLLVFDVVLSAVTRFDNAALVPKLKKAAARSALIRTSSTFPTAVRVSFAVVKPFETFPMAW